MHKTKRSSWKNFYNGLKIKHSITQEKKEGNLFLVFQIQHPRLLYRDTWLSIVTEKEKPAVKFLIEQQLRYLGINPLSSAAETISFNRIYVTAANSLKALELLGYKIEKSKGEFFYEKVGTQYLKKVRFEGKELELDFIFPLPSPWLLFEKKVVLINAPWNWIKTTDPTELLDEPDAPKIVCKEAAKVVEILPYLVLKDKTGAFADLCFENSDGDREKEKYWEKDLLETSFQKKPVGNSQYYCPIDKVVASLRFLIELGWKVIDSTGKKIVIHSSPQLSITKEGDNLKLEGKVLFEEEEVDVKKMVPHLKKQLRFLELPSGTVALIDPSQFPKGALELFEKEKIHQRNFALFQPLLEEKNVKKEAAVLDLFAKKPLLPPHHTFQGTLYPYQQEGLNWLQFLYNHGFHGLLADEMGLGKTVQVLAFLSLLKMDKPVVIVVPTSLIFNWRKEIEKFLPHLPIYAHQGKERLKTLEELIDKKIIITSYTLLRLDLSLLKEIEYECIILDEAQNIKNPKSQSAQAAFQLQGDFRLAITGTPIENRQDDLFSLFQFVFPALMDDPGEFSRKAKPFILRRTKEVIGDQLPEKIEQTIWVEMEEEQKTCYEEYLQTRRHCMKHMEVLETLLRLRQICCHPSLVDPNFSALSGKFERFFQDLETVLGEKRKVLVYSQFTTLLKIIQEELNKRSIPFAYLDGETKDRENVVTEFQQNPDQLLFLISLKAGGVGLNLTAADYVFIYDPWWNEAAEKQAIDRAHRLGRKGTLIARRYVTVNSIEEKMMALKGHKSALLDHLFESESTKELNIEDLYQIIY